MCAKRYHSANPPRFDDYRGISARFDSRGTCGHPIKEGDEIGWTRRGSTSYTSCPSCWAAWCDENRQADNYEQYQPMEY